ncbi:MAG: excinuclease ABC subunit UvrC [bacterium]|nr:excinuclease ABC subunit UvrC [bacterium]
MEYSKGHFYSIIRIMLDICRNIPKKPGVYIMRDENRRVLYVGKAKNLKNRVTSYFHTSTSLSARRDLPSPWIELMIRQIDDIETIIVSNEFEALLLENNLIKKYHPTYNIRLKDDKTFPYLKLTNEEFPRLTITRNVLNDKAKYFGPYLSANSLRQTIQFIRKNFGIVTHTYKTGQRACLNYQLGLCAAPYAGKVTKEEYDNRINSTIKFLKGNYKELLKELQLDMEKQANNMDFEGAAKTRDQIANLNRLIESQHIVSAHLTNRDIFAVYKMYDIATCTVMKVRQGKLLHCNNLQFDAVDKFDEKDILHAVLSQYYVNNFDIPKEILVNTEVEDLTILVSAFLERGIKTQISKPKPGDQMALVDLALENAIDSTNQVLTKSKQLNNILESLQRDLELPKSPQIIEAFDISNLGENQAVGAMVTFVKGVPCKDRYRKFIIKTVVGQNDVAMMGEIVSRRLNNKELPKPSLILIDGGKGQLNAACEVLKKLGLKIPIIGLVKKDELIFIPKVELPIALNLQSKSLLLLRAIRDEVHRFGISFHRAKRNKAFLEK